MDLQQIVFFTSALLMAGVVHGKPTSTDDENKPAAQSQSQPPAKKSSAEQELQSLTAPAIKGKPAPAPNQRYLLNPDPWGNVIQKAPQPKVNGGMQVDGVESLLDLLAEDEQRSLEEQLRLAERMHIMDLLQKKAALDQLLQTMLEDYNLLYGSASYGDVVDPLDGASRTGPEMLDLLTRGLMGEQAKRYPSLPAYMELPPDDALRQTSWLTQQVPKPNVRAVPFPPKALLGSRFQAPVWPSGVKGKSMTPIQNQTPQNGANPAKEGKPDGTKAPETKSKE